jgi:flagellar motility protein MotE (MotC chaperone)
MNIKGILIFSFSSLLFFIILIIGILFYLTPDRSANTEDTTVTEQLLYQPLDTTNLLSNQAFMTSEDSLKNRIDLLQLELHIKEDITDSLNSLLSEKITQIEKYQKEIDDLEKSIVNIKKVDDQAKSLAKTFESMKLQEIGRSVSGLDDKALMMIYNKMNGRYRKNLLNAVSADRAARLTKKMMSLASE